MAGVREFYDEFAESVLLSDFERPNERQDAIKALCDRFIPERARVLEIGCGAGIITAHVAKRAREVFAVDISDNNVLIAKEFVRAANVEFEVVDVVEQAGELASRGPFDAVLLADVIEHIPKSGYRPLFAAIEGALATRGRVILTYPTPEYQRHLKEQAKSALQVIDEEVELSEILAIVSLKPVYFSYRDVWHQNQYAHLVLERSPRFDESPLARSSLARWRFRLRKHLWRLRHAGFVRRMRRRLADRGKTP